MLSFDAKERVLGEVLRIVQAGELRPASEQEKRSVAEMNEAIDLLRELDKSASSEEVPYELGEAIALLEELNAAASLDELPYELSELAEAIESVDFAAKKGTGTAKKKAMPNCTPGKSFSCGYSCQSIKRNCRSPLPGQAKNYAEWLSMNASAAVNAMPEPAVPKPAAKPKSPKKTKAKHGQSSDGFPPNLDKLETVKSLGGGTGATLVRDPDTGKLYVRKTGSSPDHIREEFAADRAYEALGVDVPKGRLYTGSDGNPVKLSEYIEGRLLGDLTGAERDQAIAKLKESFAADALLGNWDVVGLSQDNVLITPDGRVVRIDNGGALRYRAQGTQKTNDQWNQYPTELWSMRDAKTNTQAADAFGNLKASDLADQIETIDAAKESRLLKALPDDVRDTVRDRLEEMRRTAGITRTFQTDSWKDEYTDEFTKHSMGLRSAGIVDRLPAELKRKGGDPESVYVFDENEKEFDNLRGQDSHIVALSHYINANGGNYKFVPQWMKEQAGSSWNNRPQSLKWFLANQRSHPTDRYLWLKGEDTARDLYQKKVAADPATETIYRQTFAAFHAFNYEMLQRIDFENNDRANRTIKLMRTEGKSVMDFYGIQPGATNAKMKRGVAESTSLYKKVSVFGSELTVQQVPHHRILGSYFYERSPGVGNSAFLGDGENEFIAMLDDLPFDYIN